MFFRPLGYFYNQTFTRSFSKNSFPILFRKIYNRRAFDFYYLFPFEFHNSLHMFCGFYLKIQRCNVYRNCYICIIGKYCRNNVRTFGTLFIFSSCYEKSLFIISTFLLVIFFLLQILFLQQK